MSKLIAKFPSDDSEGCLHIHISVGGVEISYDHPGTMTLDPVNARTLGRLLNHASHEAELMQMRKKLEDEHPEPGTRGRFSGG